MNNLDQSQSDIKKKLHRNSQRVENAAIDLFEEGRKFANHMYDEGVDRFNRAEHSLKQYSDDMLLKVKKKPLQSILIAAGVGFILSSLFKK